MILVLVDRYRLERLRYEYEELRLEVESRSRERAIYSGKVSHEKFRNSVRRLDGRLGRLFLYEVSIARRISSLRDEIERLKQQLREGQ